MPKVSVIIPVFGVEKYIERCARSLFEQTLDDIEYIFVDDCSKDNSIKILKNILVQYPQRKNQVLILKHDENKGLPIARQTGLKVAKGEYIAHCDSDDWVDCDIYQLLYNKAIDTSSDIIICDYLRTGPDFRIEYKGVGDISKESVIKDAFTGKISWAVWNKLVRSDLYKQQLEYPSYSMSEDMVLTLELLLLAQTISYVNKPLYHYFVNSESIVNARGEQSLLRKLDQQKKNFVTLSSFLQKHGFNYDNYLDVIKYRIKCTLNPLLNNNKYKVEWRHLYEEINYRLFLNNNLTLRERLGFYWRLFYKSVI